MRIVKLVVEFLETCTEYLHYRLLHYLGEEKTDELSRAVEQHLPREIHDQ